MANDVRNIRLDQYCIHSFPNRNNFVRAVARTKQVAALTGATLAVSSCARTPDQVTPEQFLSDLYHSLAPYILVSAIALAVIVVVIVEISRYRRLNKGRDQALLLNLPNKSESIGPLIDLLFSSDLAVSAQAAN